MIITATIETESDCPEAPPRPGLSPDAAAHSAALAPRRLHAERRHLDRIPAATWDALADATPWATPFSKWAFHRAWWDAYGDNAHEQTMVVIDGDAAADAPPIAIVPFMHRHEVEASDALTHTTIRHGSERPLTPVPPSAKAIFFGASYHADYATILAHPDDVPAAAEAVVACLAADTDADDDHPDPWDAIDLRRLRCGDPVADELAAAFGRREMSEGWTLNLEREEVCPVATIADGIDFDGYLATLDKKGRHEIRRKIRRAEASGAVQLEPSTDPIADLGSFIDLHQRRWREAGLFPDTPGGAQSRVFVRRLFELFGPDGPVRLSFLSVGGRRIAAGIHLQTADSFLYYNAGVDPEASDLSPGVLLVAKYVEFAISEGLRRFDFLRGDEPYKYGWGAVDEPIQRLLVRRSAGRIRPGAVGSAS